MAKKRKFVEDKPVDLSKRKKVCEQDQKSSVNISTNNSLSSGSSENILSNAKPKNRQGNQSVLNSHRNDSNKRNLKKDKKQIMKYSNNSSKTAATIALKKKNVASLNVKEKNKKNNRPKVEKYTTNSEEINTMHAKASKVKKEVKITPTATLPKKPEDFSSNWKALLKAGGLGIKAKTCKKGKIYKKQPLQPNTTSSQPEIWFDDVDESLIEIDKGAITKPLRKHNVDNENPLVKMKSFEGLTKAVSMDCEMVGVGDGGKESILARVSIVNQFGKCVYDRYVKPTEKVTDYRTKVSGIRKTDVENGDEYKYVQKDVSDILKDRILVGHAIHNDLKVLYLDHPHKMIRDTLRYKPFRRLFDGRNPSLKKLTAKVLGVSVQEGEHNSVQDAQAAMRLYTMHKVQWEKEHSAKHKSVFKKKKKKKKQTDFIKQDLNID